MERTFSSLGNRSFNRQIYHLDGLTHHGVPVFAIVLIVVSWLVLLMVLVVVKGLLVVGGVEVVLL